MAIAGLRNVPLHEPSGRRGSQGRVRTRASSILQMWRELEDECAVNRVNERGRSSLHHEGGYGILNGRQRVDGRGGLEDLSESENGSVNNSDGHLGNVNDNEDRQSMSSEQSQDIGEVERERVRQIFREWMNSGVTVQAPNVSHLNRGSRGQWLGENERERVRIVREWIQMSSQQREAFVGNREEQVTEIGSQLGRVRDGQVLDHNETQGENSRREIRRLCGRQALLDLLAKKEQERRVELQGLEATRPVSSFAHRNRIQSLIRIRAFQNMRSSEFSRSSSAAENELGLLRQRQTVSGLREGFLSRLDNSVHIQATNVSDGPSDNIAETFRDDQTQASSEIEVLVCAHDQNDLNEDNDVNSPIGESDTQGSVAPVDPSHQVAASTSHSSNSLDDGDSPSNSIEPSRSLESGRFSDLSDGIFHQLDDIEGNVSDVNGEESHEVFQHQYDTDREGMDLRNQSDDIERNVSEDVNGQESNIQTDVWTDQIMEYEEREWEGSVLSNQWIDDDQVERNTPHWLGDGEESSHDATENDGGVQNDAQEDYWHENGSQETPRDWLGMTSGPGASSERVDTLYFSDDDNVYNMEIRELLNRRTVSSLLHSGFRESLDQLIQSYVDRQTQGPDDWELREMSLPFAAHNQEQLDTHTDHNEVSTATVGVRRMPPTPPPLPQAHWGRLLRHANLSRHEVRPRPRPGTEWDAVNDLRIDMARLQQRLNNMQRMLEACMDMQLELQRSVRQEVSAALNRSISPSESVENILPNDGSKWESVRKGMCCVCSNNNINSLLYRCGHMCTCTECANILVEGNGKCPMCHAPVIEAIRAYFIQ